MANAWLAHVKKTMKVMKKRGTYKKGMGLKQVILAAKKTYKKHHGGDEPGDLPEAVPEARPEPDPKDKGALTTPGSGTKGGRRRSSSRTRRHRRH